MNRPSPHGSPESDARSVFARPAGEPGPHRVRQPYVPVACIFCALDPPLPLVALEEGQRAVWHDAGGGTFHACALREVAR